MNRSLRRQRLKEPKERVRARAPSIPRAAAAAGAARAAGRGGAFGWRPRFVTDIISELRKVVWPTRQDIVYLTVVVVIVTLILGAILGAIDIGFGWLIERTLLS